METSAQTVGLVILAVVAAITVAHAAVMVARRLMSRRGAPDPSLRRTVQVWDLGVRLSHWAVFTGIAVLSGTGYFLANPIPSRGHGSGNVTMASIRFVHLVFAVLFTASVLFRVYWLFGGNRWAGWRYWMPTTRSRLDALRSQAAYYVFLRRIPPPEIGHNALAGAAYTVVYVFFVVQVVSGFALLFADGTTLRFLHGLVMWLILAFLIHHVYSAVLIDTEDHSAMVASIFTGNKKLTKKYLEAADDTYDG